MGNWLSITVVDEKLFVAWLFDGDGFDADCFEVDGLSVCFWQPVNPPNRLIVNVTPAIVGVFSSLSSKGRLKKAYLLINAFIMLGRPIKY